jgi:photosystem II stability/assembly factor-like uncharacterized protein
VRNVPATARRHGAQAGRLALLFLAFPLWSWAEERWKIQFQYDKAQSTFDIRDLECPSAQRCIGAGAIVEKNGHEKGTALVTSDGGKNWSMVDVKEPPISLFFLNDSLGWMVTERGVWATEESGRSWKKLEGLKRGIVQVYFLDPSHGFAIGYPKAVFETKDAGKTWTKLAEADKPSTDPERTSYECISFSGQHGVIVGRVPPQEFGERPIWMDPALARFRRERQSTMVILETVDGGKHWESSVTSLFGRITQLRMTNDGYAVAVFAYENYYSLPSNVYKLKFGVKGAVNIFGEQDRAVTDVSLFPNGGAVLAAVQPPGRSNQVPIPGKLKMLRTSNLKVWEEMPVDYRAEAQRAVLAAPDAEHMWVATDTGMILSLVEAPSGSKDKR